jgi:hypothetical protein
MLGPTTSDDVGAKGVRFDLTPLAPTESAMKERLESAAASADSFAARWPIEAIHAIEAAELGELLRELAHLRAAREEGRWWAFLLRSWVRRCGDNAPALLLLP